MSAILQPTLFIGQDCQVQDSKENAIGYIYPLGNKWMAHPSDRVKGVKRSTKEKAIAYLASCA